MSIKLIGYSERGMINALCEDIRSGGEETLALLLSQVRFPGRNPFECSPIHNAQIIVEHGFSKFGDLDLLILIEHGDSTSPQRTALLIEAKVAAEKPQCLERQCQGFKRYLLGDKRDRSNLFVQLYRKMVLVKQCQDLEALIPGNDIFPTWSLGEKLVIAKAAHELKRYCDDAWFVAILPDTEERVSEFFRNELTHFLTPQQLSLLPGWSIEKWGFVCWPSFVEHAGSQGVKWSRSLEVAEWNGAQIFISDANGKRRSVRNCCWYKYNKTGSRVLVVYPGTTRSRVVEESAIQKPCFPRSFKVLNSELGDDPQVASDEVVDRLLPKLGTIYYYGEQKVKVWTEGGWAKLWLVKFLEEDKEVEVLPHELRRMESALSKPTGL